MQTIKLADGLSRFVEWCGITPGTLSIMLAAPGSVHAEAELFDDPVRTCRIEYDIGAEGGPTIYEGYTDLILVKRSSDGMLIQLTEAKEG